MMSEMIRIVVLFFCASSFLIQTCHAAEEIHSGTLHTQDNIPIAYEHYREGFDSVVIVCPGFFNSKKNRWMRKTVEMIKANHDVIIFDFRGHGDSGGKYTWSAFEDKDLRAVLDYADSNKYKRIGIVAFSLGAAVAVNVAATRSDINSMVLISCPSRFNMIDFHFWSPAMLSDLKDNIECKWEGKGARFGSIFYPKTDPVDSIKSVKNTPILFIHGDNDWIVGGWQSKKLFEAAAGTKKLEIIKGGLHAERLIQSYPEKMRKLILDWFAETL
jgi:pimeloyl-ACP methyl ester carboxylesterase